MQKINDVDSRSQNFTITSTKKPRDLPEKSCKNRGFLNIHAVKKMGGMSPPVYVGCEPRQLGSCLINTFLRRFGNPESRSREASSCDV